MKKLKMLQEISERQFNELRNKINKQKRLKLKRNQTEIMELTNPGNMMKTEF